MRFQLRLFNNKGPVRPKHNPENEIMQRRDEIEHFCIQLEGHSIGIQDLPDLCPLEPEVREHAIQVAKMIAEDDALRTLFVGKKALPVRELMLLPTVRKDVLQKFPDYITTMSILFIHEYRQLKDWLRPGIFA